MNVDGQDGDLLDSHCRATSGLLDLARKWRRLIRDFEASTDLLLGQPPPVGSHTGGYPTPSLLDEGWVGSGGKITERFWLGRSDEVSKVLSSESLRAAIRGFNLADGLTAETVHGMRKQHAALQEVARAARDWTSPTGERLLAYYPSEVGEAVRLLATSALKLPRFATVRSGGKGTPRTGHVVAMRKAVRALDELQAVDGRDLSHEELTILLMLTAPWKYLAHMKSNADFDRLIDRVRKLREPGVRTKPLRA